MYVKEVLYKCDKCDGINLLILIMSFSVFRYSWSEIILSEAKVFDKLDVYIRHVCNVGIRI